MKQIIFVRPRHHYDSYTDFFKLCDLAGYRYVYPDSMRLIADEDGMCWENPDRVFIVSPVNGEYGPDHFDCPKRKAKVIWWNLERPLEQTFSRDPIGFDDERFDETWVSDKLFADSNDHYRYVRLGTDVMLSKFDEYLHPIVNKEFDVIHLSYMSGRRQHLIPKFVAEMNWRVAPNGWGLARHLNLLKSSAMLAIHQDNWPVIEPIRYAIAAAYKMPIWGEVATDHFPWIPHETNNSMELILLTPPVDNYSFKSCIEEAVNGYS